MSRSQGQPITKDEIQRIQLLLADTRWASDVSFTDMTMTMIADRMNCTRSSVTRIKEFQIRSIHEAAE